MMRWIGRGLVVLLVVALAVIFATPAVLLIVARAPGSGVTA